MMNTDILVKVHGRNATDLGQKIAAIDALARTPAAVIDLPVDIPGAPDQPDLPVDLPQVLVKPYFDIGEATGKPGDIVKLSIEGGCRFETNGFHIGGDCGLLPGIQGSGYGLFEAVGFRLGPFLRSYLEGKDLIHDKPNHRHDHYWSIFNMLKGGSPSYPLPTEWWEAAIGFFSIDLEKGGIPPIQIPSGTEILTVSFKILEGTAPGVYEMGCEDEAYWLQSRVRRRDFLFTTTSDSEFARGGITKLETFSGKITVLAA